MRVSWNWETGDGIATIIRWTGEPRPRSKPQDYNKPSRSSSSSPLSSISSSLIVISVSAEIIKVNQNFQKWKRATEPRTACDILRGREVSYQSHQSTINTPINMIIMKYRLTKGLAPERSLETRVSFPKRSAPNCSFRYLTSPYHEHYHIH